MSEKSIFFRRIATIVRVFWLAIVCDAVYILKYIQFVQTAPGAAMARGATLTAVPAMTEHILMSAVLLLLCSLLAEILRRQS